MGSPPPQTPARRVLLAGPVPPPVNGMSNAFAMLAAGLPSHGWEITVLDLADRTPPRRREQFSLARARSALGCVVRACAALPRTSVFYLTVSQSPLGFLKDAAMLLCAHAWRVPVVAHLHGGSMDRLRARLGRRAGWLYRMAYRRVAIGIVLDECFRDQLTCPGTDRPAVRVVPNGTTVPVGAPRRLEAGPLRLAYLSNMQLEKGYLDALEVATALGAAAPERPVELHLGGAFAPGGDYADPADMERDFRARCAGIRAPVTVTWHGPLDDAAKVALLDASDLLVLPSRLPEGQPLAVVEAFSRGLPVAAYEWPGTRALLRGELSAGLAPVGDAHALAAAVGRLADDAAAYHRLSSAAIEAARAHRPEAHLSAVARCLEEAVLSG